MSPRAWWMFIGLTALAWGSSAVAQELSLPGLGAAPERPTVRLAREDPLQEVKQLKKGLQQARDEFELRAPLRARWQRRLEQVRRQQAALKARRLELLSDEAPTPEAYLEALERLGLGPARAEAPTSKGTKPEGGAAKKKQKKRSPRVKKPSKRAPERKPKGLKSTQGAQETRRAAPRTTPALIFKYSPRAPEAASITHRGGEGETSGRLIRASTGRVGGLEICGVVPPSRGGGAPLELNRPRGTFSDHHQRDVMLTPRHLFEGTRARRARAHLAADNIHKKQTKELPFGCCFDFCRFGRLFDFTPIIHSQSGVLFEEGDLPSRASEESNARGCFAHTSASPSAMRAPQVVENSTPGSNKGWSIYSNRARLNKLVKHAKRPPFICLLNQEIYWRARANIESSTHTTRGRGGPLINPYLCGKMGVGVPPSWGSSARLLRLCERHEGRQKRTPLSCLFNLRRFGQNRHISAAREPTSHRDRSLEMGWVFNVRHRNEAWSPGRQIELSRRHHVRGGGPKRALPGLWMEGQRGTLEGIYRLGLHENPISLRDKPVFHRALWSGQAEPQLERCAKHHRGMSARVAHLALGGGPHHGPETSPQSAHKSTSLGRPRARVNTRAVGRPFGGLSLGSKRRQGPPKITTSSGCEGWVLGADSLIRDRRLFKGFWRKHWSAQGHLGREVRVGRTHHNSQESSLCGGAPQDEHHHKQPIYPPYINYPKPIKWAQGVHRNKRFPFASATGDRGALLNEARPTAPRRAAHSRVSCKSRAPGRINTRGTIPTKRAIRLQSAIPTKRAIHVKHINHHQRVKHAHRIKLKQGTPLSRGAGERPCSSREPPRGRGPSERASSTPRGVSTGDVQATQTPKKHAQERKDTPRNKRTKGNPKKSTKNEDKGEDDDEEKEIIVPTFPVEKRFLRLGHHPSEFEEIERQIESLDRLERRLSELLRISQLEQTYITKGLSQAEALIAQLSLNKHAPTQQTEHDLRGVERLALKVYLSRIDLALARAQERQVEEIEPDEEIELTPLPPMSTRALKPWGLFEASFDRAEALREENEALLQEFVNLGDQLEALRPSARAAQAKRRRLDLFEGKRELTQREAALETAMRQMRVSEEDLAETKARLERSKSIRARNIPNIKERLAALPIEAERVKGDEALLSTVHLNSIARMVLMERLGFERLKLQRDVFWADLAETLTALQRGAPPREAFLERHHDLLDEATLDSHKEDIKTRCEGWQREQTKIREMVERRRAARKQQGVEPDERSARHEVILDHYVTLADLCMREEWVLGTQTRLAEIARFHIQRFRASQRGVAWYLWRGLLSLSLLLLVSLISGWWGRTTRKMAKHPAELDPFEGRPAESIEEDEEPPRLHATRLRLARLWSMGALALYLGGIGGLWIGMGLLTARLFWGIPVTLETLQGWVNHPLLLVGERAVSLWSLVSVVGWIVLSFWVARGARSFILELLEHFSVERGLRETIGALARYLVIVAGSALGLSSAGISLQALAVLFGVIGIGIGFGLQNIASNFISGFIILLERPMRRGDFIQVGDLVGEVKEISARATTIETRDAISVIVPNAEFVTQKVINWTLGHGEKVRAQVNVGVAYGSDLTRVRRTLLRVARHHPAVHKWPRPRVEMLSFGDSSLDFVLHVWTEDVKMLPNLISELNIAVDAAFREAGVTIPFPQRDLHIIEPKNLEEDSL